MLKVERILREEGEFAASEHDYDNTYLACYLDDQLFLYIHIQTHPDVDFAAFHLTHKAWSHRVLAAIRDGLETIIKPMLREQGIKHLMGVTDGNVKNWAKLMARIGLEPRVLPDGRHVVVEEV